MSCLYYIDPCIFPVLAELLTEALEHLSRFLPETCFERVFKLGDLMGACEDKDFFKTHHVNGPVVFCFPSEYAFYQDLLLTDYPPKILTPLWVLSSSLCRRLEPMECYQPSQARLFSGLIVSLTAMENSSLQRAFVSFIQAGGGQVVCQQPHQPHLYFCTHVIHDTAVVASAPCQKYAASTADLFAIKLLHFYRFIISTPLLSVEEGKRNGSEQYEQMYQQWCLRPPLQSDLLPLEVLSSWVEECMLRRVRVSEQMFRVHPSEHPSFHVTGLPADWRLQATEVSSSGTRTRTKLATNCQPPLAGVHNLQEECGLSIQGRMYVKHMSVLNQKRDLSVFSKRDVFIVSRQYQGAFRACLLSAIRFAAVSYLMTIRYLGGSVEGDRGVKEEDMSCQYFVVSRDSSCSLFKELVSLSASARAPSSAGRTLLGAEAVTDLYVFACTDFARRLPPAPLLSWTSSEPLPRPDPLRWAAIFPPTLPSSQSSMSLESSSEDKESYMLPVRRCNCGWETRGGCGACMYCCVAHCFAPLYRPLPALAHASGGAPGMGSLVVCLSGYSDLKRACERWSREKEGEVESTWGKRKRSSVESGDSHCVGGREVCDDERISTRDARTFALPRKSGSLQMQHAIRLCGACFVEPFIPTLVSHLVCASPSGRKYAAARAHNAAASPSPDSTGGIAHRVHIVSEDWLWESLRQWQRQDEALYPLQEEAVPEPSRGQASSGAAAVDVQTSHSSASASSAAGRNTPVCSDSGLGPGADFSPPPYLSKPPSPGSPTLLLPSLHVASGSLKAHSSPPSHPKKSFLLGGCSDKQLSRARDLLERLGGQVLVSSEGAFDPRCTHLLLWKFARTEKFMCACAAGKWVLCPEEYLSECERAGELVPEETFEWYFPSKEVRLHYHFSEKRAPWAGSCRRGRERRLHGHLPFHELPPVVFIDSEDLRPPLSSLRAVLEAGGGHVGAEFTADQYTQHLLDKKQRQMEEVRYVVCSEAVQRRLSEEVELSDKHHLVQPIFLLAPVTQDTNSDAAAKQS